MRTNYAGGTAPYKAVLEDGTWPIHHTTDLGDSKYYRYEYKKGGEALWVRTVLVGTLVPGLQSVVEVRRVDM